MNNIKTSPSDPQSRPWNALFSSLYLAECAAAREAAWAHAETRKIGNIKAAGFYLEMAREEERHAELVKRMFSEFIVPPRTTYDVYAAKRCLLDGPANLVERLAVVHLIFEPSAMAFLSYIQNEAETLFTAEWSRTIRAASLEILQDEAKHIRTGRDYVQSGLDGVSDVERLKIQASMKTHRAFLKGGIRRFFAGTELSHLPEILNERYEFALNNSVKGIFDDAI